MSQILNNLIAFTGVRKEESESIQEYLQRLVIEADTLLEKDIHGGSWNNLLTNTQKWMNTAVRAIKDKREIPVMPGVKKDFLPRLDPKEVESAAQLDEKIAEEMIHGIPAKKSEINKHYKIDLDGDIIDVRCIEKQEDKIIFVDISRNKYAVIPIVTVIPIIKEYDERVVNKKPPLINTAPRTFRTLPKKMSACTFIKSKVCEDYTITLPKMLELLDNAGYNTQIRSFVKKNMYETQIIISLLQKLGKYNASPIKVDG